MKLSKILTLLILSVPILNINAIEFNGKNGKAIKEVQEILKKNPKEPIKNNNIDLQIGLRTSEVKQKLPIIEIKDQSIQLIEAENLKNLPMSNEKRIAKIKTAEELEKEKKEKLKDIVMLSMSDDEWFAYIERFMTEQDKKLLEEYDNPKYSFHDKKMAFLTKTSEIVKTKAVKKFLYKEIDATIRNMNKINEQKQELLNQKYQLRINRYDDEIVGDFNFELTDKEMLNKFRKDKSSLFLFSSRFINHYFCSIEIFKNWIGLDRTILINFKITGPKDKDKVIYELSPKKNSCN